MTAYRLFNEWRARREIGENLADALARNGLRTPDEMERQETDHGVRSIKIGGGELLKIKTVIVAERNVYELGRRRGYRPEKVVQAILEIEDGRIVEVDAEIEEIIA